MTQEKEIVDKIESINSFIIRIDEKILNVIEKHDNLEKEKQDLREELKELKKEINDHRFKIIEIENSAKIDNLKQENKMNMNTSFKNGLIKFIWVSLGGVFTVVGYLLQKWFM